MKKLLMMTLIVSLLTISSVVFANTIEVPDDIRVGLYYTSSAKASFKLSSPGGIEIGVMKDGVFIHEDDVLPDEEILVKKSTKQGAIFIDGYGDIGSLNEYPYFKSLEDEGSGLCLMNVNGQKYRGNIEVRRLDGSDMTVINHLSMQEYLYGVVPREIGGNSAIEAVKAQAIVARTYAAKNYTKRSKLGFNLMPTQDDQAYGGYEWETANSNRAVDETYGEVVVYNGELIGGYYFSTSGGYTENSENVWTSKVDYLKAVPDTYEPNIDGNTSWEVTMTADEVKNKLAKNGINVGEIVDLVPEELSETGRIVTLKVIGTDGEDTLTKSNVRGYLGLKSQWYTINDDAPVVKDGNAPVVSTSSKPKKITKNIVTTIKESEEEEGDPEWYLKADEEIVKQTIDYPTNDTPINQKELTEDVLTGGLKLDELSSGDIAREKEEAKKELEGQNIKVKPLLSSIMNLFIGSATLQNSTEVVKEPIKLKASSNKTTFTFRGRGWGHAVGMSQNGAKGMAEAGFKAEEIIKWYYSGVEIY